MQLQCHLCGSHSALHPLPSDPPTAEKWKEAVPDATPDVFTKNFRLCVLHFDPIYVYHKRHILKWAIPELIHFNGKTWQKERCDYTPEISTHEKTSKSNSSTSFGPPPVVIQPAPSNVDESPVILPLPPRRDDEPDTDPLAVPEPHVKTPNMSRITSVRPKMPSSVPPLYIPSLKKYGENVQSIQNTSRLSSSSSGAEIASPASAASNSLNAPRKPKISVKSPAELSAPKLVPISTNQSSNKLTAPQPEPRILNKRAPKRPASSSSSHVITPHSKGPSQPAKQTLAAPTPPDQSKYQLVVSPDSSKQQYILASATTPAQYIVASGSPQSQKIIVSDQKQGQPIVFTENGHSQPLVQASKSTSSKPTFFQNQPGLLKAMSPQPTIKQAKNSNLVISDARSLHPDVHRKLSSPKTPTSNRQSKTPSNSSASPAQVATPTQPKIPSTQKSTSTTPPSQNSVEYTEKLARQAITTVKADIARAQKKTQTLQKKINLLKLKVTTYEGLISKLVNQNIISKQSASQCRVFQKDVIRYKKQKEAEDKAESIAKKSKEIVENNKENSNDTNDSLDSSTAMDHDYL